MICSLNNKHKRWYMKNKTECRVLIEPLNITIRRWVARITNTHDQRVEEFDRLRNQMFDQQKKKKGLFDFPIIH